MIDYIMNFHKIQFKIVRKSVNLYHGPGFFYRTAADSPNFVNSLVVKGTIWYNIRKSGRYI